MTKLETFDYPFTLEHFQAAAINHDLHRVVELASEMQTEATNAIEALAR